MSVTIDNSPNKWLRLSGVIGNYLGQRQDQQQIDDKKQQQDALQNQKKAEIFQKISQWYATADPTARARFDQLAGDNSDLLGGMKLPQGGAFQPSQAEQNTDMVNKDFATSFPSLPASSRQQVAYQKASGAAMPSESVKLTNAQDVYSQPTSFDPQMQPRQQIEDKRMLDAQQQTQASENTRDYNTIKLPESKQKISGERATAGKIAEEARGLKTTNDMLGSMTGSSATGATSGVSPIAQDIADRKYDPKLLRNLLSKNPAMAQALELQVRQIDPNFSMADYEANVATKKAYASGPQAQNVTAVNTAIRHLNSLYDNSSRMNNSRFPSVNAVMNPLARQFGNENIQEASAAMTKDADAVANELNKAFRGSSQLSEKDTASWRQGLGPNATPADIKGAVGEALKLLAGRNIELSEGYKRGVGRPADRQFIDKGVQKILQKFAKAGVQGAGDLMGDSASSPTDVVGGGLYGTYVPGQGLVKH